MTEAAIAPGRDERLRRGFVVGVVGRRETLAARRRRESRFEESATQARLVEMLQELLDPAVVFFTALENRPRSRWSGLWQKRRGVRPGLPDLMILVHWKPPVFIEMKSKGGVPSKTQRRVFADLQAMGAAVYVARSADAALEALRRHVPFRREWQPASPLQSWEGPFEFTDSRMRLPQAPEVRAERAAALKQWRLRRKQKAADQAAALEVAAVKLSGFSGVREREGGGHLRQAHRPGRR